jgi:transcriptional regulator with XRE-family HTH domain
VSAYSGPGESQPDDDPPSRRGRPPQPIVPTTGVSHRAWLEPLRSRLFDSGLTQDHLADRAGYSKARISELLRGNGQYPTWEMTYSLLPVLDVPGWPVRWLWTAAAMEARKKQSWIQKCIDQVILPGPVSPPLDHRGFVELRREAYTAYGRAFLAGPQQAE